jgi:long-subunit fatty acid transport protein
MRARTFLWIMGCTTAALPAAAWAGGFEFPANGTEALGRGGAFTAKADSPLALEYNVAGLARQRGTRLLLDSNLHFDRYAFAPDPGSPLHDPNQPVVTDQARKPFYAPFIGVSSDFGYFDRWAFAVGLYGPSAIGKRDYGTGPTRYDVVSTNLLTLFPTAAMAVAPSRFVDLGLALHLQYGSYELGNRSKAPPFCTMEPPNLYKDLDCDTQTRISARSSVNPMLSLGVLVHPTRYLDIGLNVRSGANLSARTILANGTLEARDAAGDPLGMAQPAEFETNLPWIFRLGVRYAYRKGGREVADIEVNGTYELWGVSEREGARLRAAHPVFAGRQIDLLLPHYYKDTYSVRLGGAYNQPAGPALVTIRLGLFYDSSATDSGDTRLDINTLPKVAPTLGLGVRWRGLTLNLAYAYIHSFSRTVTDGRLRAVDGNCGRPLTKNPRSRMEADALCMNQFTGSDLAPVNNGTFSGHDHLLSLGLTVLFEELIRGDRWARRPSG